jgi:uncharacterized delta-60 repeat protein
MRPVLRSLGQETLMTRMTRKAPLFLFLLAASSTAALAVDGDLDTGFGGDGIVASNFGTGWQPARAVAAFPDGSILVGGSNGTAGNTTDFYVVRYQADGFVDGSWGDFGGRQVAVELFAGAQDDLRTIVLDISGAAVLLGTTAASGGATIPGLARLTPEGDLDPGFGTGGIAIGDTFPWGGAKHTYGATAHLDGFLFAGTCSACGSGNTDGFYLYRALDNGDPDPDFGAAGWLGIASGFNSGTNAWEVAATADGRILLAATLHTLSVDEVWIYRLLASGAPDPSFGGGDGLAIFATPEEWNPSSIQVDPVDGAIYVGLREALEESGATSGSVVRLAANGDFDAGFGFPDLTLEEGSTVEDLVVTSDRKIVTVGKIDANGTQAGGFFIARLLPTGVLDNSFDGNGLKRVEVDAVPDANDAGIGITLSGGRPVAVGRSATTQAGHRFATIRLTNDLIFTDGFERGSTASW